MTGGTATRTGTDGSSLELWLGWHVGCPLIASAGYWFVFPHRTDHLGHFLAGWGATLLACWLVACLARGRALWILACVVVCIAIGAGMEATVFALGGIDGIDLASQSLGAVLAALAVVESRAGDPRADPLVGALFMVRNLRGALTILLAGVGLVAGFGYAFA